MESETINKSNSNPSQALLSDPEPQGKHRCAGSFCGKVCDSFPASIDPMWLIPDAQRPLLMPDIAKHGQTLQKQRVCCHSCFFHATWLLPLRMLTELSIGAVENRFSSHPTTFSLQKALANATVWRFRSELHRQRQLRRPSAPKISKTALRFFFARVLHLGRARPDGSAPCFSQPHRAS